MTALRSLVAGGALLVVGFLLPTLFGCGSDGSSRPGSSPAVESAGDAEPKSIPASSLTVWMRQASEYEKSVLEDGRLSMVEYEAAKLSEVQCLEQAGLRVDNPHFNGVYVYRFTIVFDAPPGSPPPPAIGECKKQFAAVLDMVWADVSQPLAQKTIDESRRMMAECYRDSGLKVEDHPEDSADPDVAERYTRCKKQMWQALDMEGISYGVEGDGRPR